MNKHNAKDYLPLIQALADGKTIQFKANGHSEWIDRPSLNFGAGFECYRIKPEPREFVGRITETQRAHHNNTRSFTITMEGDLGNLPSLSEKMSLREIL